MAVHMDIIDGSVAEDESGVTVARVAIVQGLSGNAHARMARALNVSGMPRLGDRHPTLTDSVLLRRTVDPLPEKSASAVRVQLEYGPNPEAEDEVETEFGTVLATRQTGHDANDKRITIEWTIPHGAADRTFTHQTLHRVNPIVEVQVPMVTYRVRKRVTHSEIVAATGLVGKIGDFSTGRPGQGRWLFSRFEARSEDQGKTFRGSYEFQKNPDGWKVEVELRLPNTGELAIFASDQNTYSSGYELHRSESALLVPVYKDGSFATLKLPRPPGE